MQIPLSSKTRAALRVLIAKGLEQLITTGTAEPIRAARRNARGLVVTGADGRTYSGVVVIHQNRVTTGAVVEDTVADDIPALVTSTDALPMGLEAVPASTRRS